MASKESYYDILGISSQSTEEDVKFAYRQLARRFHPDSKNPEASEWRFNKISEAYATLSVPEKRQMYDMKHGFIKKTNRSFEEYRRNDGFWTSVEPDFERAGTEAETEAFSAAAGTNWSKLKENRPEQPAGPDSPAGARFSKASEHQSGRFKDLLDRISNSMFGDTEEQPDKSIWSKVTSAFRLQDEVEVQARGPGYQDVRGERIYQFTIDALESIAGTTREIAFEGKDGPRMIRVRIPAGVTDGTLLKVNVPERESEKVQTAQARVQIGPHQLFERDGADIILKVPITVGEAVNGTELELPTVDGPVKVKIPPGWDVRKRVRLRGKGIQVPGGIDRSDLYVSLYMVLPDLLSPSVQESARIIDSFYRTPVRNDLPRDLSPETLRHD